MNGAFPTYCTPDPEEGIAPDPVFGRLDGAIDTFVAMVEPGRGEDPLDALKARERELTKSGFHDAKAASKLVERFSELDDAEFQTLLERLAWLRRDDLTLLAQAARYPEPIRPPAPTVLKKPVFTDDEDDETPVLTVAYVPPIERLASALRHILRDTEPLAARVYGAKDALRVAQDPF